MTDKKFAARVAKITDPYKLLRIIASNMGHYVDGYYRTLTSAMLDQADKLASEHEKEQRKLRRKTVRPYTTHPTGGEGE